MKKLIDLLNEYSWKEFWSLSWWAIECDEDSDSYKYLDTFIISKKYWFIKWLVDNDKIDERKYTSYTKYESLLMVLSISENPIQYLIDLLKLQSKMRKNQIRNAYSKSQSCTKRSF